MAEGCGLEAGGWGRDALGWAGPGWAGRLASWMVVATGKLASWQIGKLAKRQLNGLANSFDLVDQFGGSMLVIRDVASGGRDLLS